MLKMEDWSELDDEQLASCFLDFIQEICEPEILFRKFTDFQAPCCLHVECAELLNFNPSLGLLLFREPRRLLPLFRLALSQALHQHLHREAAALSSRLPLVPFHPNRTAGFSVGLRPCSSASPSLSPITPPPPDSPSVFLPQHEVRLVTLGSAFASNSPSLSQLRSHHEGCLLTLRGTVSRAGVPQVLHGQRTFRCSACHFTFSLAPEPETNFSAALPSSCPSARGTQQKWRRCRGRSFLPVDGCEPHAGRGSRTRDEEGSPSEGSTGSGSGYQEGSRQHGSGAAVGRGRGRWRPQRGRGASYYSRAASKEALVHRTQGEGAPGGDNSSSSGTSACHTAALPHSVDFREFRLQEHQQDVPPGTTPRSLPVVVQGDLVDDVIPGDDVTVVGVVACRWAPGPLSVGARCLPEPVLLANNLCSSTRGRVGRPLECTTGSEEEAAAAMEAAFLRFWADHRQEPSRGRRAIVSAVCPQLHGLFVPKLMLLLALIGGVGREKTTGPRVRGSIHLLITGDPGTGKSQLLQFAARLVAPSVRASGLASSSAGLTCAAVRDATGQWVLEPGALLRAHGGLCCVDDFTGISKEDASGLYEALEQQTVSVAKAGMVTSLPCVTTVVAAATPARGRYDRGVAMTANVGLPSPLLSRFDLVAVLSDVVDRVRDAQACDHVLQQEHAGDEGICAAGSLCAESGTGVRGSVQWTAEMLKKYVAYVQRSFSPVVSSEASDLLQRYFQHIRHVVSDWDCDESLKGRATLRLLESLVRVAQAHSRLMCRATVLKQDAVIAIAVVDLGMSAAGSSAPLISADTALRMDLAEENAWQELEAVVTQGLVASSRGSMKLICQ